MFFRFHRVLVIGLTALALVLVSSPVTAAPLRILTIGDSITFGTGGTVGMGGFRGKLRRLLNDQGYSVDFIGNAVDNSNLLVDPQHEGHFGWRIDEISTNITAWLAAIESPDVVLIHIGTNDFGQGFQTTTAITRLDNLISQIAALKPQAKIVVTNLLIRGEPQNSQIQSLFNPQVPGIVTAQANAGKNVTFLDMRAIVPLSDMPDQLHPNQTGYDKMANAWLASITALFPPPAPTPSTIVQQTTSNNATANTAGVDTTYSAAISNTDLLQGLTGNYVGWQLPATYSTANLNDGTHGVTSVSAGTPNAASFAADTGTSATYILGAGANGQGYDVSSLVSFASWRDSALYQQHYEIWVRKVGGTLFEKLYTVANELAPVTDLTLGGSSRVTLTDPSDGKVAANIDAIRIIPLDIPTGYEPSPNGGSTAFREIDVFGTPSTTAPLPSLIHTTFSNITADNTAGSDMSYSATTSGSDLLQGLTGTFVGWQLPGSFSPANLNDGIHGVTTIGAGSPNVVAFAADSGTSATYDLGTGTYGLGYDVSSVVSIASWGNSALFQQRYEIWVRKLGSSTFENIYTVPNDLAPLSSLTLGGSSKVTVTDSSGRKVATGIVAIRFVSLDILTGFEPTPGGGSSTFREIDVFGSSTTPILPPSTIAQTTVTNIAGANTAGADMTYSASVSNTDLLQGLTGTYAGWQLTGSFSPSNLNNGSHGTTSIGATPNAIAFAADSGTSATYVLGNGSAGLGYDVSSVVSIASWRDSSLFQQHYEIWIRKVGTATFEKLYTVENDLAPIANIDFGGSSKVTVTDPADSKVATGIDAIRFVILDIPANFEPAGGGSSTFREIDVFGTPTLPGFSNWASTNGITANPSGDTDFDGISELMEYALGLDPKAANGTPAVPVANLISYNKGALAVANNDLTYAIQTSPDLVNWTTVTPAVNNATIIQYTLPTGQPALFARLVVTLAP